LQISPIDNASRLDPGHGTISQIAMIVGILTIASYAVLALAFHICSKGMAGRMRKESTHE
jgi:hypothetical protein